MGGTLASSYTYYPGGALATATTNGIDGSFSFDELGNLVTDIEDGLGTTTYSYDAANRLLSSTLTPEEEGASAILTYYGWDAANAWRTCQGPTPSPTPSNEPIVFTYTAHGRLATYANSDTATSATYTYDAAGQRTKSVVTVGATTTMTSFAYEELSLMSLTATQGSTTWRIDYLYDEEGVPFGGVYRSPATSTSPTYFTLVTSDRGDAVELCDADGAAFAAYRYDAWGLPQGAGTFATGVWTQGTTLVNSTLAGQIASRQVLRYAGYAWDSESGLYYCSARFYDPATRQWTTGDPAKADGEESAYQYCGGEPVGEFDMTGAAAQRIVFPRPRRHYAKNWSGYYQMVLMIDAAHAQAHLFDKLASNPALGFPRTWWWWAYDMVRGGQPWDLKLAAPKRYRTKPYLPFRGTRISPEDFGNIHFGYTGRSIGLTLSVLKTGSFAANMWSSVIPAVLKKKIKRAFGSIDGEFDDHPRIARGYNLLARLGTAPNTGTYFVSGR